MKQLLPVLVLLGSFASGFALPIYDPFADATAEGGTAYTPGDPVHYQTNALGDTWYATLLNNTDPTTSVRVTDANLTFPGLPGSGGNAVWLQNNIGRGARMYVADSNPEFIRSTNNITVYYSLLVQLQDITDLSTSVNGQYLLGFNNNASVADQNAAGNIQGAGLFFRKEGTQYQAGIGKNPANDTVNVVFDPALRDVNETVFIVAAYEIVYDESNPLTDDDNVRLWVNPPEASFGSETPPEATVSILGTGIDINGFISSFQLMNRSTEAPNVTILDDIRLGHTWAFVTGGPEVKVALPSEVSVGTSTDLVLSVEARSGGPSALTYRWQQDGVDLEDGGRISGATTATLTVSGVISADAGLYAVIVSNDKGSAGSETLVEVTSTFIATQPESITVDLGGSAEFSVAISGAAPLSYAWYYNDNPLSDGGNISGSSTATLTVSPVSNASPGSYHVVVETAGDLLQSDDAILTVAATPGLALYWDTNAETPGGGGDDGNWGDANWSVDAGGGVPTGFWLDDALAVFSAGEDATGTFTVTMGIRTVSGIDVEEGTVTLSGGTITLASGDGEGVITVAETASATIGAITSAHDVVKAGGGLLRLNANNTQAGRTIIRSGKLSIQNDTRFGVVPEEFTADNIILDGGTLLCTATGHPGVQLNANRGIHITENDGTIEETNANDNLTGALTVLGVISGPGKLTKTGPAVLRLESNNTFSGGLDFNEGRIYANADGALGTGDVTIGAAPGMLLRTILPGQENLVVIPNNIILTEGADPIIAPGGAGAPAGGGDQASLELSGVISGPGGFTRNTTGDKRLILTGDNTFSGGLTFTHGSIVVGNKSSLGTGTLTIGQPGPDEFIDPVTGAIIGRVIQFNGLADMTGENAMANPIVAYQQFSMAINISTSALEFSGPVDLAADFDIRIFANYPELVHGLSGVISSSTGRGFIKRGVGTLVLGGANTYPGGTTIASGTLRVNNTSGSGTGSGPVMVETHPDYPSATLGGSGTIAGHVSASSTAIVSPGAAVETAGRLTLQDGLSLASGATVVWELAALADDVSGSAGTDFDQISVTGGSVALGTGATLALDFLDGTWPNAADPFWQQPRQWTVVSVSGSAASSGEIFESVGNAEHDAGAFSTSVGPNGSVILHFTPSGTPPVGPAFTSITAGTGGVTFSWPSENGVSYRVEYKNDLNESEWLTLTTVAGDGTEKSVTDPLSEAQRFYRLVVLTP